LFGDPARRCRGLFLFRWLAIFAAPYPLTGRHIVAMRIVGNDIDARLFLGDPNTIRGYSILQTVRIDDPALEREISAP
jgi:hypothetical protein